MHILLALKKRPNNVLKAFQCDICAVMSLGLPQDLSLIVIHNIDCLYFLIPSVYQTL